MESIELKAGLTYQAVNESELALIGLLLEDAKKLQQLKPNNKTTQNIKIAESMLRNRATVMRGYNACKKLCDQNN